MRPLGQILLEMEPLVREMAIDHDTQYGDFLGIWFVYYQAHLPGYIETYLDGTHPFLWYGPQKNFKKKKKNKKKTHKT